MKNKVIRANDNKTGKMKNQSDEHIRLVAFWGICILMFISPFFRGLFFPEDQEKALLLTTAVFLLILIWKWKFRYRDYLSHPIDFFMIAYPLTYILSAFNAANYGFAVDEITEVLLYFFAYWCFVQLLTKGYDTNIFLWAIYGSAAAISLTGLMSATGLTGIKDGFQVGRIASSFQYPNALASYLAAVFMIGIYFWWVYSCSEPDKKSTNKQKHYQYLSYLLSTVNYIILSVFIGTRSIGGFIVLSLGILLFLVLMPGRIRLPIFFHLAVLVIPASFCINNFLKNALVQHFGAAWLYLLPGLLFVIFTQWLFLRYVHVVDQRLDKKTVIIIVSICMVIVLAFALIMPTVYSIKYSDIFNLGLAKLTSLSHRANFIEDAVKMIKDRPIFGWGGGGWQEAYHSYQSYNYSSNQVHSYYIQVAVETGIVGLSVLIGLWLAFFVSAYKAFRKNINLSDKVLTITMVISVFMLGTHASMDFDLSLSAISLIMYSFIAIIRNKTFSRTEGEKSLGFGNTIIPRINFAIFLGVGVIVILYSACLITSEQYLADTRVYISRNNIKSAIDSLGKAGMYNPFNAQLNAALGELYSHIGQKDKALTETRKAISKSKYDAQLQATMASMALERGDSKEAVRHIEETVRLTPWVIGSYEAAGYVYRTAGLIEVKKNNRSLANEFFTECSKLPDLISNRLNEQDQEKKKLNQKFYITEKIMLNSGVSNLFLGNFSKAEQQLHGVVLDKSLRGEASAWLSLLSEKLGDSASVDAYLGKAREISPEYEKIYREYKSFLK